MKSTKPFALCLDNTGYLVRIMDESGEDYLFHKDHFAFVDFPRTVKKRILALENR